MKEVDLCTSSKASAGSRSRDFFGDLMITFFVKLRVCCYPSSSRQEGLSILMRNCTAKWSPDESQLRGQGWHTEGVSTIMVLGSFDITTSKMWPRLCVGSVTLGLKPRRFKMLQSMLASTPDLLCTWKFKSSVIIISRGLVTTLSKDVHH